MGQPTPFGSCSVGIQASIVLSSPIISHPRTLEHSSLGELAAWFLFVPHPGLLPDSRTKLVS